VSASLKNPIAQKRILGKMALKNKGKVKNKEY
jgi:hypothetical protein